MLFIQLRPLLLFKTKLVEKFFMAVTIRARNKLRKEKPEIQILSEELAEQLKAVYSPTN